VPPEAESEEDVVLGFVSHLRSNSAAWPWPTPMHIVANP
jgi:hypothetical protein